MTQPGRGLDAAGGAATVTGILAAAEFARGEMVAGRFRIEKLLGMGGMGVVYHAHDVKLDVPVALKLLRPELATRPDAFDRFRQELLLARQVSSPHVVRIHDLVQHESAWLISMDYVDGRSLEKMLDERGALPPEEALRITRQLAQGLSAAHQRGVVHRDLKPANVLVNAHGDALVTDFGVARSIGSTGITGSGVIIGTPEYLSPEQARAEKVDGRSDLYALGLMLYEMLSGKLPFSGGTPAEMLAQRIVRSPPPVSALKPDIPALAAHVCARLLELRPARRFQSAEEVIASIDSGIVPARRLRQAGVVLAGLVVVALAFAWQPLSEWWTQRQAQAAAAAPVEIPATTLDVAVMPARVIGGDAATADLARGVTGWLAWQIGAAGPLALPDDVRVARALAEQGLDADGARRFRPKVFAALSTTRALETDVAVPAPDRVQVSMALRDANGAVPLWQASTGAIEAKDLPDALRALSQQAAQALGATGIAPAWPATADLQTLGALARTDTPAPKLDTREGRDALAWQALATQDRAGRTLAATALAGDIRDALGTTTTAGATRARAYAALVLGEHADAITLARAALVQHPHDHALQLIQARAVAGDGDFDRARALLEGIVREDPRNIDAWYNLGKFALMQGDAQRAADEYLVRAEVLANRLGDARLLADVTNAQGIGYRQLGQLVPAGEKFEKAARLRGALTDARGEATSLRNLATVRAIQGDFAAAQSALDRARTILAPLGDAAALADVANDVGVLEEERGEYRKALAAYREALNFRQTQDDRRLVGESLINVGFAYYQIGEFDNAQVYWQQAQQEYARIDDRAGAVRAEQSLGLAYLARGELKPARAALAGSLAKAEDLQLADEHAASLAGLAELDRVEGRIGQAIAGARAAHAMYAGREDPRGMAEMRLVEASASIDIGDWSAATKALADLGADAVGNREQAAMLALRQAAIALGENKLDEAARLATGAVDTAVGAHTFGHELEARLLRARIAMAAGDAALARREAGVVREGLTRFGSVPLQLIALETTLALRGSDSEAAYRDFRARLAPLPGYGRAWIVHANAALALRDGGVRDGAATAAREALTALSTPLSTEQRDALQRYAAALGVTSQATP